MDNLNTNYDEICIVVGDFSYQAQKLKEYIEGSNERKKYYLSKYNKISKDDILWVVASSVSYCCMREWWLLFSFNRLMVRVKTGEH